MIRRRSVVLLLSQSKIRDGLVGSVQVVKTVEVADDRTKDERWIDGGKIEIWFLLFDEFPSGLFGKSLFPRFSQLPFQFLLGAL